MTAACPRGHRCESCGTAGRALLVVERDTAHGPYCLTQCPRCAHYTGSPPIAPAALARFVDQHAAHLNGTRPDTGGEVVDPR